MSEDTAVSTIDNTTSPVVFKLSSPLITHRGEKRELEINQIKARAFVKHGGPVQSIKDGLITYNYAAVMHIAADSVDGLDDILIQNLSARDLQPLARTIMEMCLPFAPSTTSM